VLIVVVAWGGTATELKPTALGWEGAWAAGADGGFWIFGGGGRREGLL